MTKEFDILDVDAGIRVDKYLSEELPDISRSYIQKLIKEEQITVNGKVVKPSYDVKVGDIVKVKVIDVDTKKGRISLSMKEV